MSAGDIFSLPEVLRLKDINMTLRYVHLAPDAYADEHDRLEDLVPANGPGELVPIATASERR